MGPDSAKNIVSVSDFAKGLEVSEESRNPGGGGFRGEIPMIVRLHLKGVSFSGIRDMKGWDFTIQSIRKGTGICHLSSVCERFMAIKK